MLFTDASPTGPGGFIQGSALVCHKNWSAEESQKSSTWRELVPINFALEAFSNHLAGPTVACSWLLIRMFLESSRLVEWLKNYKTSF